MSREPVDFGALLKELVQVSEDVGHAHRIAPKYPALIAHHAGEAAKVAQKIADEYARLSSYLIDQAGRVGQYVGVIPSCKKCGDSGVVETAGLVTYCHCVIGQRAKESDGN